MSEPVPPIPWEAQREPIGPAPGLQWAPHGARLVAYLIDSVVLTVVSLVIVLPAILWAQTRLGAAGSADSPNVDAATVLVLLAAFLLLFAAVFLYFPFFWSRGGQTPGMRPFGLRVVRDRDGGRIGWGTASLRMLGMYVASSVFYLGFAWVFVDKRRRGWHDLIASTVVIKQA